MTPERIGQILLALHAAGWRVDVRRREGRACVTVTAPVTWEGERHRCHGPTLGDALAAAWRLACGLDPGPAQRMRETGGKP